MRLEEKQLSELLRRLAPGTRSELRERFVSSLLDAMPRYGIDNEHRIAAFLATCAYESQYFQKTREGRARQGTKARRYQDAYWSTGFYGRGLIQLTHVKAYYAFTNDISRMIGNAPDFVAHPELLELPQWAVESACWYWQTNDLSPLADAGKFFEIQGKVNRGNEHKEALGESERLSLFINALAYLKTLNPIPKPHTPLSSADAPILNVAGDSPVSDPPINNDVDSGAIGEPKKSILSRISDSVTWLQGLSERGSTIEASVSKSSWATVIFQKALGLVLLILGFFFDNPLYLILAVVLIAVGAWYLKHAKERASDRSIVNVQVGLR